MQKPGFLQLLTGKATQLFPVIVFAAPQTSHYYSHCYSHHFSTIKQPTTLVL
jgi:hypothetical protein